jgi:hypothetical protein
VRPFGESQGRPLWQKPEADSLAKKNLWQRRNFGEEETLTKERRKYN